jgi:hypothetical protein
MEKSIMPSPFPGMDPYLEENPLFHELHTQVLAEAQVLLQPQLLPHYIAWLESHLSEGSVWDVAGGMISLEGKEPDLTLTTRTDKKSRRGSTAVLAQPSASVTEELDEDELELRRQRRIVIYMNTRPRQAVASIELLSPSNKRPGSAVRERYLEKRSSALHGGLHWIEIDLLRGGQRPPIPIVLPRPFDYLAYVAQAIPSGWNHLIYGWMLRQPLPRLPIPLLGDDQVELDLAVCFRSAYDRIAAAAKVDYDVEAPPPPLRRADRTWLKKLLRANGLRP